MNNQAENVPKVVVLVVTAKVTAETFVNEFAKFIARCGNRVIVIADGLEQRQIEIGTGTLQFIEVPMMREPSPLNDVRSLMRLFQILGKISPDCLIYATPKASLLSSISGFILRIPVRVYQVWGLRLETTSGLKRIILNAMEVITSSCSSKVLANSRSLASRYQRFMLFSSKSVDVTGEGSSHGVDINRFSPNYTFETQDFEHKEILNIGSEYFKVGFVGRLHPDKGIDTLFDGVEEAARSGLKIALILVGGDEGADMTVPVHSNLICFKVGHITDVRPYYSIMDVLALPSLREGFPNVVLEAAAMRVPAIVSDGTGVVDSVIHGKTGLIHPVGNSHLLAEAIQLLAVDSRLRDMFGAAARDRVEASFAQESVWSKNLAYFLADDIH